MRGRSRAGAGRPGWHAKTGQYLRMDVRRWQREGLLALRGSFVVTWRQDDGEMLDRLEVVVQAH